MPTPCPPGFMSSRLASSANRTLCLTHHPDGRILTSLLKLGEVQWHLDSDQGKRHRHRNFRQVSAGSQKAGWLGRTGSGPSHGKTPHWAHSLPVTLTEAVLHGFGWFLPAGVIQGRP